MTGRGRRALLAPAALLAPCAAAPALRAQAPAPSVGVGFGVDTTVAPVGAVVRLVRAYLARPDTAARARGLWSAADPTDRRAGDLARGLAYQGFPATVVGVLPVDAGDSVYVVRILHATADSTRRRVTPLALQRLYAVRVPGAPYGWQLAGALPRLTAGWERRTAGRLVYHYAPGQRPDPAKAAAAARFVDSVAALFAVPAPARIDYYVTASPEAYYQALGLDFFVGASGPDAARGGQGGRVEGTDDALVLAGDPAQGEAYRHELTHAVLGPRVRGWLLGEGVATWLGGSRGRSGRALYAGLAEFQRARPALTLEALLGGGGGAGEAARAAAQYATAALVVDAVYRRAGAAGLRALRDGPADPAEVLALVRARLGLAPSDPGALDRWWRDAAARAAAGADDLR